MNKSARLAKEIQRISAYSGKQVMATNFQFSGGKMFVDHDYLMVNLPKLEGSLQESEETLEKVKSDFMEALIEDGVITEDKKWWGASNRKNQVLNLVRSPNWEIAVNSSSTVIGIRLTDLAKALKVDPNSLEQAIRNGLKGVSQDPEYLEDEAETIRKQKEEISKLNQEKEDREKSEAELDAFRKEHGKQIMKEILSR